MATLQAINSSVPVVAIERGQGHKGVFWIVQPENFPALVEHINKYGGPSFWELREATTKELAAH